MIPTPQFVARVLVRESQQMDYGTGQAARWCKLECRSPARHG